MDLMGLMPQDEVNENQREPVVKHECEVVIEEDEVEIFIRGKGFWPRFRRWMMRARILSTKHYYAETCLKSSTAISNEINRHLHTYPYMIHPFSPLRNRWSIVMVMFTFFSLLATPFLNSFFFREEIQILPYVLTIDTILLTDMTLHFFTGCYDERTKMVTLNPRVVFLKYAKTYFVFDFLAAAPFELIDFMAHGEQHIGWYCSALNFIKILKIRNLFSFIQEVHKSYHLSFQKLKVLQLAVVIIVTVHWAACLVYYVPKLVMEFEGLLDTKDNPRPESWILSDSMKKRNTKWKMYILCLNRATISLVSSAHFLDVATPPDLMMNLMLAVFGKIGYIYLLAQFLQLMATVQTSNKERLRLLKQVEEYMQYKELPRETQKRLLIYCNYYFKKNFSRDRHILNQVSEPLREELTLHNYSKLLQSVDLFSYLPHPAIVQLVNYIKSEIYLTNDVITKAGTQGESLFFIGSGTVAVYTSLGKEVCHLEDGSYFGEIALVMENEQRVANVVAIETCEILVVPREAFHQVIAPYPNLLNRLQMAALERLEKTLLLDEIYNLDELHPRYINISNIRGRRRG